MTIEECPTCLEPFTPEYPFLPCGHRIHRECIEKGPSARCHLCRFDLEPYGYKKRSHDTFILQNVVLQGGEYYEEDLEFVREVERSMRLGVHMCKADIQAYYKAKRRCGM